MGKTKPRSIDFDGLLFLPLNCEADMKGKSIPAEKFSIPAVVDAPEGEVCVEVSSTKCVQVECGLVLDGYSLLGIAGKNPLCKGSLYGIW